MVPWYQKDLVACFTQGVKFTDVWHIKRYFSGTLILYHTHKYTQKHTEQSGPNRLTQPHKHILKPPAMRSQQISVLHWINNSHIKNLLSTMSIFKNYSHVEVVYMLIRFNKPKFILWNTNITDKNGANKQNTHTYTKHSKNDKGKRLGIPLF